MHLLRNTILSAYNAPSVNSFSRNLS